MRPGQAVPVVLAALALGVVAQYLFVRERIGVNAPIAVALFLAAAWRTRDPGRAVRPRDLWLPIGALVLAALCALRADAALLAFDVAAAPALALGTIVALRGPSVTDLPLVALLEESLAAAGAALARMPVAVSIAWPALRALAPARSSHASGYVGGLLLATPFLVVFATLFSSADAVFQNTLSDALDLARLREIFADMPSRVVVVASVAWAAGGALAWLSAPGPARGRDRVPALVGADALVAMLLAIDVLFAVFVVVQVAYLFGGRDTIVAAGVTYSAYARRGFFELVAVASLVGALVFFADLVV
ncbi:MAG TPA: DUF4153 domain-containing protein, partial [Verrucomicrobiae bacterium]|nr:DUF4153 domain-containing protein [Verrucomicrobiae bacterium]